MPPTQDELARRIAEAAAEIEELEELPAAVVDDIFIAAASHWRMSPRLQQYSLGPG